ncbi:DUF2793 domain-containing protein [Chelativorans sp.]|uniref:DUF2793 domain-containing protein n=1 Tax=Chelativorans sp. TaxID=2203393 RepID=UPI0028110DF1|nr:DUF2793 domain-containing protein [Chelativorans sp.]
MDATANLNLPFIMPSQAQKHVTHNDALLLLDSIVQLSVRGRHVAAPPAEPHAGDRYIVPASAGGEWVGREGNVAAFQDGAWIFLEPRAGWQAWVADEGAFVVWDGTGWNSSTPAISQLQNLALLGIGTEADGQNVFAAKLNKALWTGRTAAEGGDGDLRYTLNKEGAANVLSLLLQSGFSARAELGLMGADDFSLKVSSDGSLWREALKVDRQTGIASMPALPRFKAFTNYDNYVGLAAWTKIGINQAEYNDQNCSMLRMAVSWRRWRAAISSVPRCSTRSMRARMHACAAGSF